MPGTGHHDNRKLLWTRPGEDICERDDVILLTVDYQCPLGHLSDIKTTYRWCDQHKAFDSLTPANDHPAGACLHERAK
jgi:hypothetical protein